MHCPFPHLYSQSSSIENTLAWHRNPEAGKKRKPTHIRNSTTLFFACLISVTSLWRNPEGASISTSQATSQRFISQTLHGQCCPSAVSGKSPKVQTLWKKTRRGSFILSRSQEVGSPYPQLKARTKSALLEDIKKQTKKGGSSVPQREITGPLINNDELKGF